MSKFDKFADNYVPPIVGFILFLPIMGIWWLAWGTVQALILMFVPFGHMDHINHFLARSWFNPDALDRKRERLTHYR